MSRQRRKQGVEKILQDNNSHAPTTTPSTKRYKKKAEAVNYERASDVGLLFI